jgi:competence protein ComEC
VGVWAVSFTLYDINTRQRVFEVAENVVPVTGVIEEKRELGYEKVSYLIKTEINGVTTKVLLTAPDTKAEAGDVVKTDAALSHFRNTGVFPERSFNHSKGILLKGEAESIELIEYGKKSPLMYIREYNQFIRSEISSAYPNENGNLLRAVCLGDKSGISGTESSELAKNIQVAGISHYTAVSGLHMTMIVHMLMLVYALTPFRNNRRLRFAVLVIAVLVLAVFFDLTRSVTRSAIMLIIVFGGELFMRKGSTFNSLGLALMLILLFEPYAITDAGLLMSFSGTFGVGVAARLVMEAMPPNLRNNGGKTALFPKGIARKLLELFIISACASLCVLPVSAIYFGGISVLSPLTSVIVLPFFTVAVGAIVLFSVFAMLPALGQVFLLTAGIMSRIMNTVIEFFGQFQNTWISLDYWFMPLWVMLSIIAISIVFLIYKDKSKLKSIKAGCITVATLALMICVYNMNAVNSGRTYITIYSDSVSAWTTIRQGNTEAVIVTVDTPRAFEQIRLGEGYEPTFLALLKSERNYSQVFGGVTEPGIYEVSGKLTLDINKNETLLKINDSGYKILFTKASNDEATLANVVVAGGWVRNKRELRCDYVVYASRSMKAVDMNELNAYYEPVYLMLEEN